MLLEMQTAAFLATVLLLAAFAVAHTRHPSDFSALWVAGWTFYALRFAADIVITLTGESYLLALVGHLSIAISAVLLLLAVSRLSETPVVSARQAGAMAGVLSAYIVVSPLFTEDFFILHAPMFFAFGTIQLFTAYLFYQYLRQFTFASTPLIVGAMFLWGVHKLDFPFLRPVEWFAPYGYALGAIFALLTGLGVVMFLLEDAEREAREQRQTAQRTAEEYQSLFNNLTDPVYIHDFDGNVLTVNETAMARLGYSADELESMTVEDVVAPDRQEDVAADIDNIVEAGSLTFRSAHQTAEGDRFPVEVHSSVIQYKSEPAVLSVARDITAQVEREAALEKFKQAAEAAGHAVYITDPEGTIEYVNPAFERITGYAASDALGRNPRILNSGEMPMGYFENLWKTIQSGDIWEEEVINERRDGGRYHAHQTIAPITVDGTIEAYVAIQTDITELKEQERRLQRYKQTIESSTNLLAALDADRRFVFANQAYREFHDVTGDVAGMSIREVLPPATFEAVETSIDRARSGEFVTLEQTRESADGEPRTFDIQYFPLQTTAGTIQGVGVALRDITEKRERIEAIRELSEYRRVMSAINHRLVQTEPTNVILPQVTGELSRSDLFGCTFLALFDEDLSTEFVCGSESGLDDDDVAAFHSPEYVETVFDQGIFKIDDVTTEPFRQHVAQQPSHEGVGIAITHEDEELGILTVHFPPGEEVREIELRLLRELAADLGLFLHSQSLEQNLRTFKEIAERIDDPIMLQDREGAFEVVNQALSEYANLPKEELIGKDESAFMDEDAAATIAEKKALAMEAEEPVQYQVSPTLPGKGVHTFSTLRYPHYDEDGTLDGTVAICRDISDLKEREQHLRVLDRVLRHNVNNQMTVVEGFAETIHETTDEPSTADYARKILDNSESLVTTVQKERDISKMLAEPHTERSIDLVSQIRSAVDAVRTTHPEADIDTDLPDECQIASIEAIGQAVEELVRNAVIHSDQDTPEVTVSLAAENGLRTIRVADSGPGIPEMERDVLTGDAEIEPLYHGSGLGLWLVNLIVSEAEGYLQFEENQPRGSVVSISLSAE